MAEGESGPLFDLVELKKTGFKAGSLIAVDPNLLSKFMTHLSKTVRRDEVTKAMVFLAGVSAYTRNPINLFMRGPSSIGKSYNTTEVLKYFPEEDVLMLGGLSPTALVHDYGILYDAKGEEIDPSEKPTRDKVKAQLKEAFKDVKDVKIDKSIVDEEFEKAKKQWTERMQGARYIVDLNQKILVFLESPPIETYNKLRPILSHDKEEISYKFTDKEAKGKLRTMHVVLKGWPATIFCSTEEKYVEDLATRGFTITPEMLPVKYQAAGELIGERKAHPRRFREDFDFTLLQGYFRWLKHQLASLNVAIPYAQKLAGYYPFTYARSMRDFDHFATLLEISALFHYAQRPIEVVKSERPILGEKEGETVPTEEYAVLATIKDLQYVLELWRSAEETTVTGLPGHILDFYHKAVEPLSQEMDFFTYENLTQKYNEVSEQKRSSDAIRKWVQYLCDVAWLSKEEHPVDKRKVVVKVIKTDENSGYYRIRTFPDSFKLEGFKKWLDEEKKISEENQIFLKENLIGEETSIESIYKSHYSSDIFSEPSKAEEAPKEEKRVEISGFRESPIIPKLLTFDQILSGPHGLSSEMWHKGTCALCGEEKNIEFHFIDHKRQRHEVCADCAWEYSSYLERKGEA